MEQMFNFKIQRTHQQMVVLLLALQILTACMYPPKVPYIFLLGIETAAFLQMTPANTFKISSAIFLLDLVFLNNAFSVRGTADAKFAIAVGHAAHAANLYLESELLQEVAMFITLWGRTHTMQEMAAYS